MSDDDQGGCRQVDKDDTEVKQAEEPDALHSSAPVEDTSSSNSDCVDVDALFELCMFLI